MAQGISGFSSLRFGSRVRAYILAISERIPMQLIVLITRSIQKDADTVLLDPQLILIEGSARINGHYN